MNFTGSHDTSASVTVRLFIDEATNNDMFDEGEDPFPTPAMLEMVAQLGLPLALPISLEGPGVGETNPGTAMPDGSVVFSDLRAGDYQLSVSDIPADVMAALPAPLQAVLRDFAYGGPAAGYPLDVGVGEQKTQHAPIDITHTTVNFSVSLKSGDETGDALPGATVKLYADAAGTNAIDGAMDMTDEMGMTAIRVARAGTTGNMVHAGVATEGYDVADGMTAVAWDPQKTYTMGANDNDIVNLNVDVTFGAAGVSTAHPESGQPLAGWAVSVMHGEDAVEGADEELDDDGNAAFETSVEADDLPATFTIAVDTIQTAKDAKGYRLDGGEKYAAESLEYVHNGLSLAGTAAADAGTIEVQYTTQTLKVYVHQDNDQVVGYTGNVVGGDVRMSGMVDVEIRYVENGARRQFTQDDSISSSNKAGVYTFSNVPADRDVIAIADEADQDEDADDYQPVMVLDPDEVPAYTGVEANGIMGGAFGDMGGFSHTAQLCPLASRETDQRFREDNCGTFAFVETYDVTGQVWKNVVTRYADDFKLGGNRAVAITKEGLPGFTLSMDPVDGENIAGESADPPFEAKKKTDLEFDFGQMPAGVYTVTISGDTTKWNVQRGPVDDPTDDLKDRINPLDSLLNIDVSPATGYVYGAVTDADGQRAAGVTVDVNGVQVETDAEGRYIAEGFLATSYKAPNATRATKNRTVVKAHDPGKGSLEVVSRGVIAFAANTPRRVDFSVSAAADIAEVSGTVTHSSGGAGVGGVEILVDGKAPLNATYVKVPDPSSTSGSTEVLKLLTADDGSYTARIEATGSTVEISAEKEHMFFTPEEHTVSAVKGAEVSGINFSAFDNGTIRGRVVNVVDGDSIPLSGVIVSAIAAGKTAVAHADTTGATGSYTLRVPYGRYTVTAVRDGYTFSMLTNVSVPNDGSTQDELVGTVDMDNANLGHLYLSDVSLERKGKAARTAAQIKAKVPAFDKDVTAYTDTVANSVDITTVTAGAAVHGADVDIDPGDDDAKSSNGHQIALEVGDNDITVTVTPLDSTTPKVYTVEVYRSAETTTIEGTITDADGDGISAVEITVDGTTLINGSLNSSRHTTRERRGLTVVKTNSDGEYTLEVESAASNITVTPWKSGYTFDPASRDVRAVANATITGIDFEGSANATITGRVTVTAGGAGLSGATVSARPRDGGGTASTATTRSSGRFTIRNVSIGWNTVTVEKDGYTFTPRTYTSAARLISATSWRMAAFRRPTSRPCATRHRLPMVPLMAWRPSHGTRAVLLPVTTRRRPVSWPRTKQGPSMSMSRRTATRHRTPMLPTAGQTLATRMMPRPTPPTALPHQLMVSWCA